MSDCKCLEIIEEKLTKHHGGGSKVELELKSTIITDPKATEFAMGRAMPPLYYTYQNGNKRKRSFITFAFCPFCGEKK